MALKVTTGRGFILGTGSRYAPQWLQEEVCKRLFELSETARTKYGVRHLTIVHGGAQGVDRVMMEWTQRDRLWTIVDKPFKADWDAACITDRCNHGPRRVRDNGTDYCQAQGSYRNGTMVEYLAKMRAEGHWTDAAAFFENPRSAGTMDCVKQAEAAGFEVKKYGRFPGRKE